MPLSFHIRWTRWTEKSRIYKISSIFKSNRTVLLLTADVELCECSTLTATVKILASYQLQIAGDIWRLESRWTSCVTPIHVFFSSSISCAVNLQNVLCDYKTSLTFPLAWCTCDVYFWVNLDFNTRSLFYLV